MRSIGVCVLLGGCVSSEIALSRQGLVQGTAASGGIGVLGTSTVHREDGVQKILAGVTTLEEVLRVTRSD